jgi:alpha-mannosidase
VFDGMVEDIQTSLGVILRPFAAADYAASLNPFPVDQWQPVGDEIIHVQSDGVGLWPIVEREPIEHINEPAESFQWQNEYYRATIDADGVVQLGNAALGRVVVSAEHGDTYSDEVGKQLGIITPTAPPLIAERSRQHIVVAFEGRWQSGDAMVTTAVRLTFDHSPLLKWEIDLDSRGTNLRVDLLFETGQPGREIVAGMPFDVVQRPFADTDLLPRQLPQELQTVLLGQRELNRVSSFPMHDFVALTNEEKMTAILAKGIRSYAATESGIIALHLRRAVEWVTEANLRDRIGDAGPFFYVPDARCERAVRHEVAVAIGLKSVASIAFQSLLAAYQTPPLLVRHKGSGKENSWQFLQEAIPMSSLQVMNGTVLARFYNPTNEKRPFSQPRLQTDVWGEPVAMLDHILPKQIVTVQLADDLPTIKENGRVVELLTPAIWCIGPNASLPDPAILQQLEAKIEGLAAQLAQLEPRLSAATGAEQLRLQHQAYIWQREKLEFELSLLLNRRKLAEAGALRYGYLYEPDKEIAALGLALNRLRIKRRIFDYVIQAI